METDVAAPGLAIGMNARRISFDDELAKVIAETTPFNHGPNVALTPFHASYTS